MNIVTETNKIQDITRTHLKTLYSTKLENPEEMDEFLGPHGLPKLDQEEINNVNRPVTSNEVESVIKKKISLEQVQV